MWRRIREFLFIY